MATRAPKTHEENTKKEEQKPYVVLVERASLPPMTVLNTVSTLIRANTSKSAKA